MSGMSKRSMFDCSVCCDTFPISKQIICPSKTCLFEVCISCQKRDLSLSHNCMNCKMKFTNKFLIDKLGKTFVTGPLKQYDQEALFQREKALLPDTQPLVDWERIKRVEMAKIRYRIEPDIPPKPDIHNIASLKMTLEIKDVIFTCPKNACRGFIVNGKCGVCLEKICIHCREVLDTDHTCDPNLVENIKAISSECKPCPQCTTAIFKIAGCNHMKCQACNSHFEWDTGRILKTSSNHHYDNIAGYLYTENIVKRNLNVNSCEEDTVQLLSSDLIPREIMEQTTTDSEIFQALYDDPLVIRSIKRDKYNEQKLNINNLNALVVHRVQFMLDELTEVKWKSRIYTLEKQKERDLLIGQILVLYLTTIRDFQSYVYDNGVNNTTKSTYVKETKDMIKTFIQLCNDSFSSVRDEYGGIVIKIRDDFTNPDLPAIIM